MWPCCRRRQFGTAKIPNLNFLVCGATIRDGRWLKHSYVMNADMLSILIPGRYASEPRGKTKRFVLDDYVVLSRSGGVGIITLNRPTTRGFWDKSVARQLVLALNAIEFDDSLRATVLTVAAPCTHLTKVLEKQHPDGHKSADHDEWDRLYEAMCLLKKPRVAAINSIAAGSAFQVALLCDIRIAHARAMMGRPGWVSGISGLNGAIVEQDQFTKIAANGHIRSHNLIAAERCLELGLINQIVPKDDLIVEGSMLAQNLAAAPHDDSGPPKRRLWELSSKGFRARLEWSKRAYEKAYRSAKPAKALESLLEARATRAL